MLVKFKMADKENICVKEGNRNKHSKCKSAAELSDYLKLSVKNILCLVPDEEFVSVYKTCYNEFDKKDEVERPLLSGSSNEGKKYRSQFNDMILRSTSKTIEETVLNMDSKLKELEELKLSQINSEIQWRPPGDAHQHMIPFEYISQLKLKKELESKIEKEQEALRILKTRLIQKRIKAKELHEILLNLIEEIKSVVTSKVSDEELQQTV